MSKDSKGVAVESGGDWKNAKSAGKSARSAERKTRGRASRWDEAAAQQLVAKLGEQGVAADLAFRIQSTRTIGQDRKLVLAGVGTTSVKTRVKDVTGETIDALCIQGRGCEMVEVVAADFPTLRLKPLLELCDLEEISSDSLRTVLRRSRLDPEAVEPPSEALLHANLAARYLDFCQPSSVLALTDQPRGEALCREVFGDSVVVLPYLDSGLKQAQSAKAALERAPDAWGLVLLKQGLVTFGDDARESYERLVTLVELAEKRLRKAKKHAFAAVELPSQLVQPAEIAPILRGALSLPEGIDDRYERCVLTFRTSERILDFVNGVDLSRYGQAGPVVAQTLRLTKAWPVVLPAPELGRRAAFASSARRAIDDFAADYRAYFRRNSSRLETGERLRNPLPRVALVRGLGIFTAGPDAETAALAADQVEDAIEVISAAEAMDRFESLKETEVFDAEFAPGEDPGAPDPESRPLAGQVVVITGGAGAIGRAAARLFHSKGAEVVLIDVDLEGMRPIAEALSALAIRCDVTEENALEQAFERVCETFGGLDVLVSNAGATWQGRIGEIDEQDLRKSFELNFFAHHRAARAAVSIMLQQGTGGCLLFNTPRQAISPAAGSGPYSLPKAATLALVRQYAVDYGVDGIRANAVSAEGVRGGLLNEKTIANRALARGVSEEDLLRDNLLRREVRADDVARAFVDLALADKTTAAVISVDGGNIASALR